MQPAVKTSVTYAEYLELERTTDQRHEFLDGEVFAMAGGTLEHGFLGVNMTHRLKLLVGPKPCLVGNSDIKVRIEATGLSTYPDALVVCGAFERSADDAQALTNPLLLVEVLSESTEAYDRGAKFAHYRRIPSLRDYVLVSQREKRIEVFHRGDEGRWAFVEATGGGQVPLLSLDGVLRVDEVYQGLDLPDAI